MNAVARFLQQMAGMLLPLPILRIAGRLFRANSADEVAQGSREPNLVGGIILAAITAVTLIAANVVGTYGRFIIAANGVWSYTMSTAHQELAAGQPYFDNFTITTVQGVALNVSVSLLGTNDAPTGASKTIGLAPEGAVPYRRTCAPAVVRARRRRLRF